MDLGDATTWAPLLGAAGAIVGGCASVAASWLVVRTQRGMQHDPARAKAYSTLLARAHEVLASGALVVPEQMAGYLESYYEVCVLASEPVAGAAGVLHEVVRLSVRGQAVPRELETQAIDDFVAAAKGELGFMEPRERTSAMAWPSAYRVLRLPRSRARRRHAGE
jgi:hypothetical protein